MTDQTDQTYDVAILGAGFEGGLLASILAYNGVKVLLIDAGTHPRFALGESTVRHTFRMLKIMGERFGVPELKKELSSGEMIHKHVTSACGVKKNFGFVYHRPNQPQNPQEATQVVIPPFREGYEAHLFRQDIDAFLTNTAIHHGATVHYRTSITGVDFDADGVTLTSKAGEKFRAKYVCDGSGGGAVLPKLFDLRENPPRVVLQSRCLFTHMVDVKPYDDLDLPMGVPQYDRRMYEGTCHHLFDGGWLWVIPFDNREGSTNKAVSVGLSFDMRKFPKPTDITPDEEWHQFLDRFPAIKAQFKDAKLIRDWVSSDRLQTTCRQVVGDRWCLLAATSGAGFLDALFSRGLATCCEIINATAALLLKAVKDGDFSEQRFSYLKKVHEIDSQNNDRLVRNAYTSFRDFELWNAWFRIWALGVGLGDLKLASVFRRYKDSHDESILPDAEEPMGLFYSQHEGFKQLFENVCTKMEGVEAGTVEPKECVDYIFKQLAEADFVATSNGLADPEHKCINLGRPMTAIKTLGWLVTSAPPEMKEMSLGLLGGKKQTVAAATA